MIRQTLYILSSLSLLSAIATAAPRTEAIAARDAQWAQEERDTATRIRDYNAGLATDSFRYGNFVKDDLVHSKEAAEAEAVIHEKIAAAHDRGDDAEAAALRKPCDEAARINNIWRERIADWRSRQATAAPDEQWFQEQSRWYHGAMNELAAWAEARKAAAEAWGRVAEAVLPGADPNTLVTLKEQAYALDAEREIAEMRFTWAYQREQALGEKRVITPEVTRRLDELKKAQDERIAFRRAEVERSRQSRQLERSLQLADQEFRKAYDTAQREALERARERASRK
jgi:hypothetical protein